MKNLIFIILFATTISVASAQKQYDYAILEGDEFYDRFTLHINNTKDVTKFSRESLKSIGFYNLMILEIKKMEKNGWELFDLDSKVQTVNERALGYIHFYYFRKEE